MRLVFRFLVVLILAAVLGFGYVFWRISPVYDEVLLEEWPESPFTFIFAEFGNSWDQFLLSATYLMMSARDYEDGKNWGNCLNWAEYWAKRFAERKPDIAVVLFEDAAGQRAKYVGVEIVKPEVSSCGELNFQITRG